MFTVTKNELTADLRRQQLELKANRRLVNDMGIRNGEGIVNPLAERAMTLHKALTETREERAELQASLVTIQVAIQNGADLRQPLMSVADVVGKEFLLNSVGLNDNQSYALALFERQWLEDRADLEAMKQDLGPNHPDVISKRSAIEMTRRYMMEYPQRATLRLAELQNNELGPMLVNMVQSKLFDTSQREASLQVEVDRAEGEAVRLNDQLTELQDLEKEVSVTREMRAELVKRMAATELNQDSGEVRTEVTDDPIEPGGPVSPNLKRTILMALMGGLAVGLALVYVLDTLDDRFRSVEEMQDQLGSPVLAMVRQLERLDTTGAMALQMHVAPEATQCEAFRTLRTAMELAESQTRHLVISSAEPGDGKTTVLANLAVSYAQANKKTLLIDADLRRPGLTTMMGMRGLEGLSDVIGGDDNVAAMASKHIRASGVKGLDVLASGPRPTNPAEMLADRRFSELLAWAETVYDQILIDSPPALATSDTVVIGRLVDGVVMVVQPDKNQRRLVIRAADSFAGLKIPLLGVVVNRIGAKGDRGYYDYSGGYSYGEAGEYGAEEYGAEEYGAEEYGAEESEQDENRSPEHAEALLATNLSDRATFNETDLSGKMMPKRTA